MTEHPAHRFDAVQEAEHFDRVWTEVDPAAPIEAVAHIPGMASLEGKRVLIASCGSGVQMVGAWRAGATDILAVDISPMAVESARRIAEVRGIPARCEVMDLHDMKLPDQSLDLIYGAAVLHHLDIPRAAREFRRVLRPGGIVFLQQEPTFFNPLLRWAYRLAFGPNREGRRRRFLGLTRTGTDNEMPLTRADIDTLRHIFPSVTLTPSPFMLAQKLSHVAGGRGLGFTRAVDRVLGALPGASRYSYEYDLTLGG